jgi:hypothetical protein
METHKSYLDLPFIKTSQLILDIKNTDNDSFDINIIPEKYRKINYTNKDGKLKLLLTNGDDFVNVLNCCRYHGVKYLPYELYDFIYENRKECYSLLGSIIKDQFTNELMIFIKTNPKYLIKKCAKHGMFNLLKYCLENVELYPLPDKACNYAVGSTPEHFECFKYLYENYAKIKPQIMNKFTISHKMARKTVPICYLQYLHKNCCYLQIPCDKLYCDHTPWYTDCVEKIIVNDDIQKFKYLCDMNFEFDEYAAQKAIETCNVPILKYMFDRGLYKKLEVSNNVAWDIIYSPLDKLNSDDETKYLAMLKFLIEIVGYTVFDRVNYTIFNIPLKENFMECIKYLIENGAKVGGQEMNIAVKTGKLEIVEYMHNNINKTIYNNVLYDKHIIENAANNGYYDILCFLIKNNYTIGNKTHAKHKGHIKCYELLLEHLPTIQNIESDW